MVDHRSNWKTGEDGSVVESELRIYPSQDGSTVDVELANFKAGMVLSYDRHLACAILNRFTDEAGVQTEARMHNLVLPGHALVSVNNRVLIDEDFEDVAAFLGMLQISGQPRRLRFLNTVKCSIINYRDMLALKEVTKDKFGFSRTKEYILAEKSLKASAASKQILGKVDQESIRQMRDLEFVNYLKAIGGVENLKPAGVYKPSLELKEIIRRGIPIAFRPTVWMKISLASQHRRAFPDDYYSYLLEKAKNDLDPCVAEDIEKDIDRTFPEHDYFSNLQGDGVKGLRNILQAYALHNEDVGYCQALNFLAGTMLLYLDEEDAFWLFVTVVDTLLPEDYFSKSMVGMYVDQMVFSRIIQEYLPKIHDLLEKEQLQLPLVTVQWFMCIFVTTLRHDVALRIWDIFLNEGSKVIFRIACALFKLNETKILQAKDGGDLFMILKKLGDEVIDADVLLMTAYKSFDVNGNMVRKGNNSLRGESPRLRTMSGGSSFVPSPLEGLGLAHVGPSRNHTPTPGSDSTTPLSPGSELESGSQFFKDGPILQRSRSSSNSTTLATITSLNTEQSLISKIADVSTKTSLDSNGSSGSYYINDNGDLESVPSPVAKIAELNKIKSFSSDNGVRSGQSTGITSPDQKIDLCDGNESPAFLLRKRASVQSGVPPRRYAGYSGGNGTSNDRDGRSASAVGSGNDADGNTSCSSVQSTTSSTESHGTSESGRITLLSDKGNNRDMSNSNNDSNASGLLSRKININFRNFKRADIEAWRKEFRPEMEAKFNQMEEARREWREQEAIEREKNTEEYDQEDEINEDTDEVLKRSTSIDADVKNEVKEEEDVQSIVVKLDMDAEDEDNSYENIEENEEQGICSISAKSKCASRVSQGADSIYMFSSDEDFSDDDTESSDEDDIIDENFVDILGRTSISSPRSLSRGEDGANLRLRKGLELTVDTARSPSPSATYSAASPVSQLLISGGGTPTSRSSMSGGNNSPRARSPLPMDLIPDRVDLASPSSDRGQIWQWFLGSNKDLHEIEI